MKRLNLLLWLALVLAWSVPAWTMPTHEVEAGPSVNLPMPQAIWRTFAPPEGRFSVLLPSSPASKSVPLSGTTTAHLFFCLGDGNRYIVDYKDYSGKSVHILGPDKLLAIGVDAFLKLHPNAMLSKHSLTDGPCLGEEIIVALPHHNQETFRAYFSDNRMYHLRAMGPVSDAEAKKDREKFLDSFILTTAKPPEREQKTP